MLNVTNLRNGTVFTYNGDPWKVLNYEHIKMARGGAFIKVKCENLLTGVIKEMTFNNGDKVDEANVETRTVQYLYSDEATLTFMDMNDFTQFEMSIEIAENESKYLIEGRETQLVFFEGKPIGIKIPASMFYKVIEAPPSVKGNTATNATKTIKLENGLKIEAPLFIKEGDVVKINTETCGYVSRGK